MNNFNISVAVTEEFMNAVESGGSNTRSTPANRKAAGLNAKEVFEKIVVAGMEER